MTGTTAGNPLDQISEGPPSPLAAPPSAADIEVELQRIARRRLAPPSEPVARGARVERSVTPPFDRGGFDSPEGFVFGSD